MAKISKSKLSTWLGLYRQCITNNYRAVTADIKLRALDQFFSRFPERRFPEDIFLTDIQDYIKIRISEGYTLKTYVGQRFQLTSLRYHLKIFRCCSQILQSSSINL